jgi:outer membrane protein assembly factor BamB
MANVIQPVIALLLLGLPCVASGEEWPQFRGPGGSGSSNEAKLPAEWSAEKNLAWKVDAPGRGWSSPIVWGDKVFLTAAYSTEAPKAEPGDGERGGERGQPGGRRGFGGGDSPPDQVYRWEVICLDRTSGKVLWKQVALEGKPRIPTHSSNTYASETPVTDGERVIAYFGMHGLYCYDFDGKLLWKADPGSHPMVMGWGTSSSPVIDGGLVFLQIDNEEESMLMAFDCKTGEEQWSVPREEHSNWSTPLVWKNKARTELVTCGAQRAIAYDPSNGAVLWQLTTGGRASATPVCDEERLYIGTSAAGGGGGRRRGGGPGGGPPGGGSPNGGPPGGGGRAGGGGTLFAVRAGTKGDITLKEGESANEGIAWSQPKGGPGMASPLLYQGYVYILEEDGGMLSCYDAKTGEPAYVKERIPDAAAFWASPWAYDGKVFCLDDQGTTHVVRAGPKLEILGKNALDDQFWATPAIAGGSLILRGVASVYCIRL